MLGSRNLFNLQMCCSFHTPSAQSPHTHTHYGGICGKGAALCLPKICLDLLVIIGQHLRGCLPKALRFRFLNGGLFGKFVSKQIIDRILWHLIPFKVCRNMCDCESSEFTLQKVYLHEPQATAIATATATATATAKIFFIFFVTFIYDINCTKWSRDWPNNKSAGINLLGALVLRQNGGRSEWKPKNGGRDEDGGWCTLLFVANFRMQCCEFPSGNFTTMATKLLKCK